MNYITFGIAFWFAWSIYVTKEPRNCYPPVVQTQLGASVESIQRDGLLMSKDYVEFAKAHDLTDGGIE